MFRASHAMLKSYRECPRRYKFIYVDHLQDAYKQPKAEFTMGQHVHTALKKLLSEVPKDQRSSETARTILRNVWKTNRSGFTSRDEEASYGKRALGMLDTFVQSAFVPQSTHLEQSIQYIISDGLMLFGRVDRIDQDSSGAVHLIDYKTGSFNPAFTDKSQLAIYSVLVARGLSLPIVSASYWYLEQNEFVSYRPTESDLEAIVEEVIMTVERIQGDQMFPATPSNACKWCEFIDICPAKLEALAIKNGQ